MSSEVQLTDEEIEKIAEEQFKGYFEDRNDDYDLAFGRAIEQAVRAQWAAEVERRDIAASQFSDAVSRAMAISHAQRDSAQAEAKAAKADAVRYRLLRRKVCIVGEYENGARFHILNLDPSSDWKNALSAEILDAAIDAQLATPTNPRAGETA